MTTSAVPIAPRPIEGNARRRFAWKEGSLSKKVPLWTPLAEGQVIQGVIRVPLRLCRTQQHTNERLEFDNLIRENIERWVGWRAQRGWFITEKPKVAGPFMPLSADERKTKRFTERVKAVLGASSSVNPVTEFDHGEDLRWYTVTARFRRETPVYAPLEDMLFIRDLHNTYGEDMNADSLPWNVLPEGKDVIEDGIGFSDPMKVAAERRARLGLKREDYLMGDLRDPL